MPPGGAAHPTKVRVARTVDLRTGKALTLKDLFGAHTSKAVKTISEQGVTSLAALPVSDGTSTSSTGRAAARHLFSYAGAPLGKQGFKNFRLTDRSLLVELTELPFAIGPRTVRVSLKKLPSLQIKP